jgi:hypothetical protein
MYPEDRVLVGVMKRKVDFVAARDHGWYRIPMDTAPKYIDAEYIAFFFSRNFKEKNGGIYYYARRQGHELVRRRDLLPHEPNHPNADKLYYKIALGPLQERTHPILNPTSRVVAFIFTTWDRFISARNIADLYSVAEYFVDRASKVLEREGVDLHGELWHDGELRGQIVDLRKRLEKLLLRTDLSESEQAGEALQAAISALGGITLLNVPFESYFDSTPPPSAP